MECTLSLLFVSYISFTLANDNLTEIHFPHDGEAQGLQMWRIDIIQSAYTPTLIHANRCEFDTHATYIVLETTSKSTNDGSSPRVSLEHTIYYWLGAGASEIRRRATARFVIHLDFELGHRARHIYRVEENMEPVWFASLFLNVFEDEDETAVKLFLIKGEKTAHYFQMKANIGSLNHKDSFMLLSRNNMFIYKGTLATEVEAKELNKHTPESTKFKSDRGNRVTRIIKSLAASDENIIPFLRTLGGSILSLQTIPHETDCKPILIEPKISSPSHKSAYQPGTYSYIPFFTDKIQRVDFSVFFSREKEHVVGRTVLEWPLYSSKLESKNSYFLNTASEAGLFVWLGKNAKPGVQKAAVAFCENYTTGQDYSYSTLVTIVKEEEKNVSFGMQFADFNVNDLF